jgi:hypothetical protein
MIPTLANLRTRALPLLVTAVAWAASACATPSRATFAAPALSAAPPKAKLAVLPIDIDVRLDGMEDIDPAELAAAKEAVAGEVRRLVFEELPKRGYDVTAALDWDGSGKVDPAAIDDMVDGLVAHANSVAWKNPPGGTIDPDLTRYLGDNTGASTLLYVNGTALANTSAKKAWQAAAVVGAVLVIAAAAIAAGHASSHHGHGGGHVRSSAGHVHSSSFHHHYQGPLLVGPVIFIHPHAHFSEGPSPEPVEKAEEPGFFDGERVRIMATLVDAATGEILWHVDEQEGLDPRDPEDLAEYVGDLLRGLPRGSPASPPSGPTGG